MAESAVEKAVQTQLRNIEAKTGRSLEELRGLVLSSGFARHGEIRDFLKKELGLGHGDADAVTHFALASDGASRAKAAGATEEDVVAALYSGAKAGLRPIHDRFVAAVSAFGPFEAAPKKTYLSLRRKKQFAMIGPATRDRVEIGFNMRDVPPTERLVAQPPGGMCQYKVRVAGPDEVDAELIGWARTAFDAAG